MRIRPTVRPHLKIAECTLSSDGLSFASSCPIQEFSGCSCTALQQNLTEARSQVAARPWRCSPLVRSRRCRHDSRHRGRGERTHAVVLEYFCSDEHEDVSWRSSSTSMGKSGKLYRMQGLKGAKESLKGSSGIKKVQKSHDKLAKPKAARGKAEALPAAIQQKIDEVRSKAK